MWRACVICVVWCMYICLVHVYVKMCVIHGIFYILWSVCGMHVYDVCVGMWYMCSVCWVVCMCVVCLWAHVFGA